MPPWLWATQMSKGMGAITSRVRAWRRRILPTTGPLPWVMISWLSWRASGRSALAVSLAISFCSREVPSMSSGWVALPPMATMIRLGMSKLSGIYSRALMAQWTASALEGAEWIPAASSLAIWAERV